MAPFKVVTLDDRWDQMNRSFMMPLTMSFAYLIDYGIIAGWSEHSYLRPQSLKSIFHINKIWRINLKPILSINIRRIGSLRYTFS